MNYRIVWSLEKCWLGKTGDMDTPLDPANSREVSRCDYRNGLVVQAERDPYISDRIERKIA